MIPGVGDALCAVLDAMVSGSERRACVLRPPYEGAAQMVAAQLTF